MKGRSALVPLRYAGFYLLVAGAWILFSDRALSAIAPDLASFAYFQTVKGLFFVGATAGILYGLLRRHGASLEEEVASRLRSEASTREVEERLRLATRAANVGLWDWDLRSTHAYLSPEWKRQLGYEVDEVEDDLSAWQRRLHPDDAEAVQERLQRFLASRETYFESEFRLRHRDGSYRSILAQASVERDPGGRAVRMLGSHIDFTERRRAEQMLRRHQMALDLAHEAADLGFWSKVRPDGLLHLDDRAKIHYGFDHDPAGYEEVLSRIHPEDRQRFAREFAEVTSPQGSGRIATEYRVVHPNGSVRWLAVHVRVEHEPGGSDGRATLAFGTSQDITDRKRAELSLRESEERLRQSQKMEAIGLLAGGVAHDFNNMLVVIQGHVDLMRHDGALSERARESCAEIHRAAERAAGLTRQLLLFSRRQVMQLRDLDLNAVVADTTKMLKRILGEHVELQLRCARGRLPLRADSGMIEQVLLNLAVNARDAMPDGGRLLVETSEAVREGRAMARLDVVDTGSGIAPENLPRIFEPFFTTKEVGKGTGLGLATVFGVVQEHGGTIEVDSTPGEGTRFRVLFPLVAPAAERVEPLEERLRGGSETLLLVEDEPSVRTLAARLLAGLGYRVLVAASGGEALEIARMHAGRIDLVVTDVVMPGGVSGFELGRRLASSHPTTKVVYTSGYSPDLARNAAQLRDGANFLAKPFSPRDLASLVRQRLDER